MSLQEIATLIDRISGEDGFHDTAVPGVRCIRFANAGEAIPTVYTPSLCLIAQGAKQVMLEDEIYRYQPSQYLAISVDLPVVGQVTEASPDAPYLCLQMDLDAAEISELVAQMGTDSGDTVRGIFVGSVDAELLDSLLRLARLLDRPKDIPMLAPLAKREVYYRLLAGEHGRTVASLGVPGGNMNRILRALHRIKSDFARPLRVEELAEMARMSPSSFHHHFREVTAMSPLQYQKRLRLTEARRILLTEDADATSTAYRVGYESPSQFSREYARMFGAPPVRDVSSLRSRGAGALSYHGS